MEKAAAIMNKLATILSICAICASQMVSVNFIHAADASHAALTPMGDPRLHVPPVDASLSNTLSDKVCETAEHSLGIHYRESKGAKFVSDVYRHCGLRLPSDLDKQMGVGFDVPSGNLRKWQTGDRLYFSSGDDKTRSVAIYLGYGVIIHVSSQHDDCVGVNYLTPHDLKELIAVRRSRDLVYHNDPRKPA